MMAERPQCNAPKTTGKHTSRKTLHHHTIQSRLQHEQQMDRAHNHVQGQTIEDTGPRTIWQSKRESSKYSEFKQTPVL